MVAKFGFPTDNVFQQINQYVIKLPFPSHEKFFLENECSLDLQKKLIKFSKHTYAVLRNNFV